MDQRMNAAADPLRTDYPAGTPVTAADAPQYQTGSQPQPVAGAPNAVTAPGGTRSHVGDGAGDNRAHNDSHQLGA